MLPRSGRRQIHVVPHELTGVGGCPPAPEPPPPGALLIDLLRSAAKCGIQAPPVVALVCKSLANMDGTVRLLDPDIDVLATFQDFVPKLLEAHAQRMASPARAAKLALDVSIGSQRLPFQIGSILEKAATGRLRLVIDPLTPSARH